MHKPHTVATLVAAAAFTALPLTIAAAGQGAHPDTEHAHKMMGHEVDIAEQVEKAVTASDQEAIATRFDEEAADLEKQAAGHEQLAKQYAHGMGGPRRETTDSLAAHCRNYVEKLRAAAAEKREMAALHREMAEQLEK